MRIIVQRRTKDPIATNGEMFLADQHECYTLEPPDAKFLPRTITKPRCIPAGTYPLTIRWSARFQRLMPHVDNVPGFAGVEIHWGNFPKDTEACTLVGQGQSRDFVSHSVAEFDVLFQKLQDAVTADPQQVISYIDPPQEATP
jgi:hypothetical protein